jgi:AraC-like DNA-binding protein
MLSGDLSATVDGKKLGHLSSGSLLYIPAGVPYSLKSKYLRAVVVTFDTTDSEHMPEDRIPPVALPDYNPSLAHTASLLPPFDKPTLLTEREEFRESLTDMAHSFTSGEGAYRAEASAKLKLILLSIAESADEGALPRRLVSSLDSYIRENVGEEISNTEIGAIFGYHPFYVSKVLKDRRGVTLRQYIIGYRLKSACRALELTDKSAAEIAEENGFTDASYFAKTFKAAYGLSPKEYRNKFKEDFI